MNKRTHTCPAWLVGPRPANFKFGGGSQKLGDVLVGTRLKKICEMSDLLLSRGVIREPLLTSAHTGLELESDLPGCPANQDVAIRWEDLLAAIDSGDSPRINALTAPAFGFSGAERGAMLSKDATDREMAAQMHREALLKTLQLKESGRGEGRAIWWPAFAGWRWQNQRRYDEARQMLLDFWVSVLGDAPRDAVMHFEFKPGDPAIDYVNTPKQAIEFCLEVNQKLNRRAMLLNNEAAHWLACGYSTLDMVSMTIEADLFDGFFHANSGLKLPLNLDEYIDMLGGMGAIHPADIPVLMDLDWGWGVGSPSVVDDQKAAVVYLKENWHRDLIVEHDLHPDGDDPYRYFILSVQAFEAMWNAA